jgi:hypothetical protein
MTDVRGPETKRDPSAVNRLWWRSLEPSNIVRPESKPRASQAETTSDSLGHSLECRFAITTPVDGELLTSGGS